MEMKTFDKLKYGVGAVMLATAGFANAAIDTQAITDVISDVAAAAAIVGAAAVAMHFGIKAYRWLRGAA
ncbi:MAG: major capsid protein [Zoogloeaceae bacterium]|jgi:Trk-type K+ transport system membrane component|nr:major capsid protein [Zoogloeaceae bacterium]